MKALLFTVLVSSFLIVACGERPETRTISDSSKMNQAKKETVATSVETNDKSASDDKTKSVAKPAVKLPGQFKCDARDSVWYNVAKIIKVEIEADLSDKPLVAVKSQAKELNFKIGREFIEGDKIDQEQKPECENTVDHTDVKYEWTYTCRYFVTDIDGSKKLASSQKSYFRVTSNGVGQLCRVLDQSYSQCWDLSECK